MTSSLRWCGAILTLMLLGSHLDAARGAEPPDAKTFEARVRPILKAHCFHCHGEQPRLKGALDLRRVRTMIEGGDSGAAIEPGHRDESLLWQRITDGEMPPGETKLTPEEQAAIGDWIDHGAITARPESPEALPPGPDFSAEERGFWSFQPIRRGEPPRVAHNDQVRNPIDAFLLSKLESQGRTFSPEADRRTLIRRATLDLLGLPPTPEEIAAFEHDPSPNAYEKLIDRLLDSPHYGERWARHWLDVAGYADSDGGAAKDAFRPNAYKYRDYLIRAINTDRPWNELIQEQLAGDELLKPPYADLSDVDRDRLIATGFLLMAPDTTADPGADALQARNDVVTETIKIVSSSLLGLTVGCAQCHIHRYDPISHEDYYRFRALFEPALDPKHWRGASERRVSLWHESERRRAREVDAQARSIDHDRKEQVNELVEKVFEHELETVPADRREAVRAARNLKEGERTAAQKELLKAYPRILVNPGNVYLYENAAKSAIEADFDKLKKAALAKRPAEDFVRALTEIPGQSATTHLFDRGDPNQPRQAVAPGELSVIAANLGGATIAEDDAKLPTTGRRLAYARLLTSGRHPLVARVLVNRVWMNHFGRGIVATPADFGALGERPSHPELLDWLADAFQSGGWRLKALQRWIMTSAAYRQSSRRTPELDAIDPENRLLGRMPVRRLEAESIRDSILAASGQLNTTMLGPGVPIALDESGQVLIGLDTRDSAGRQNGKPGSLGIAANRRSLYVQVRRGLPLSFTEAFDAPTLTPNCERRNSSTVAPQALALMNNEFVIEQAEALADAVIATAGSDPAAQVGLAWNRALGTEPTPEQATAALRFLTEQEADFTAIKPEKGKPAVNPHRQALASLAQMLIGSNAFLYVD